MKSYKVHYVNYKGKDLTCYIHENSEKEARETASVMQGMFKIIKVEDSGNERTSNQSRTMVKR